MESRSPFYAYKETRLDLDPSIQHSTVAIRLPQLGASTWSTSRTASKRSQILELPVAEDEDTFRQRQLATAASVYHRQYHRSPRSFLWRVLESGKVLSIRVVDVSRDKNAPDSNLTLRFYFQSPIMPCGVAFSDSREHDVLSAFVMTDNFQLHTLSLRPDYFRKTSSTEGNVEDWCKSYLSPAFGFKKAHRLIALNSDEVIVSLIDGGLLKLVKKSGGDGLEWKEIHYNEGGWSDSFRNLVPFRRGNTIQYGKHTLEISSATSIASPATLLDGAPYAFTVSLDHRLRVWNLATGKIAYMGDLLNQEMDPNEAVKKVIDPSLSQLVKVYGGDESAICVTYSPLGTGQFKFWNFVPKIDGSLEATDLFPHNTLEPRAPTSDLWTMADFSVVWDSGPNTFVLWTMWKNNTTYRVQTLEFANDTDSRMLRGAWTNDWKAMATETLRETPVPTSYPGDSSDITDKYLEFIMFPGKYTTATIETGLALYEHKSRGSTDSQRRSGSLPERLCSVIASSHSLGRMADGSMDYDQLRLATEDQWRRFCRLLSELDKLRGEAQSLVIDPEGNMPWVVLADGLTAIRECSKLERIIHNPQAVSGDTELIAMPLIAASEFRESFSDQFLHSCKAMLLGELFEDPSLTDPARMLDFYNKCDFANQIGDEDYQSLVKNLGGGFKNITTEVCDVILDLLRLTKGIRPDPVHPLCEYGNKLIVKGVQEVVELHHNVCLDQLILLILIEGEVNHGEDGIKFETGAVFSQLLTILRTLELLRWLTSTQISVPLGKTDRSSSENERSSKQLLPSRIVTVFEALLHNIITLDLRKQDQESMPPAVTEILLRICTPDGNYEQTTSLIQCLLLRLERPDLAMDLQRFTAQDAYSVYIQGRTSLAYDDPQTAAVLFKKAAFGMSDPSPRTPMLKDSGSFLNEIDRSCLNAGLPEYYSHIVSLYEKEKLFSFVIDFARLALQFIRASSEKPQHYHLRTEMHSRLFTAAVQTSRFDLAHSALTLFTDHAIQRSSLRTLIMKMCETSYASQLIQLPFIGLQDEVDEILAQKCQSIVDVTVGVQYHKILYAWRIKRNDFRGAAAISLERLQRLQQSGDGDRVTGDDGLETPITKQYVALINALSCVDPKQAWILCEEPLRKEARKNGAQPKRKVVTLEDIRRDYQAELDRIAAIENNQFAFAPVDEMDVL
ncbi:nucleoporin Nup120/160-domain-containing protein [Tricladium varicosporioides]|nr:nucleoporin Nup120/160-domain-containing protein [Hymenoscyphus varicosporioides]